MMIIENAHGSFERGGKQRLFRLRLCAGIRRGSPDIVTRISSVLEKAGSASIPAPRRFYSDTQRELVTQLLLTEDVFRRALFEKAPNEICEHAYQIAALFSRFYHDSHVLSEPELQKREDWLATMALTKRVLELHLHVLGIEPVDRM